MRSLLMSDSVNKAVFLSYASQDAEAAKRICDALRAAGVEVWFDQSELRGGDSWDAKIRKQIKECSLFVPVVSVNTQRRHEGYFRLEWHLAEQRSHLIARGRPFIVPVTIDETRDAEALVPDAFLAVQWMKLPAGEANAAFVEQVRRLLSGEPFDPAQGRPFDAAQGRQGASFAKASEAKAGSKELKTVERDRPIPPSPLEPRGDRGGIRGFDRLTAGDPALQNKPKRWLKPVIAGAVVALVCLFMARPWEKSSAPIPAVNPSPTGNPALVPVSEDSLKQPQQKTVKAIEELPVTARGSAQINGDAKSVAVLAFANLSDDKGNEYFSDGISEELLNVLAKIPNLKVAARTSAFYFKGKEVPVPEIARQLGVAYVVEGSVRKAGDKVRITAQLIKATDGFHVWSDTFTRDLKDIFAVQDEIAGLIAKNLELKMGMTAARPTIDVEAYQEYLAGRAAVARASHADLREAVGHFERAVAIEPKFAAAWVQLASAHTRLGRWGGSPTLQAWQAARAAIDRALALEPDSPEVQLALGWILRTAEWDWYGAERAFRRTLELQPNQPDALAGTAVLLFNIGKTEEAYRLGQQAVQLDPLNASTQIDLSIMYYMSKNWAEGGRAARRALQLAPKGASYHCILAWNLIGQQRFAEAETEIALDSDAIERANASGVLAIARGQEKEARVHLAELEKISGANAELADLQNSIAGLCAGLGEKDRAFAALDRAAATRDPSMAWLLNSWYLGPLFSDPRWSLLVHKLGLADEQLK
jgi:TolB-like protein/Flp pilus assembly protein TadD